MSVGVSIANSVLLITNAEHLRMHNGNARQVQRNGGAATTTHSHDNCGHGDGNDSNGTGWGEGETSCSIGSCGDWRINCSTFAALFILHLYFPDTG